VIRRVVAIGGPPGSGKSTAGRLVADALGLDYRAAGDLFRSEAQRHGMDLEAFGDYAAQHPEVDRALDGSMQELARPGRLLDGRLPGVLLRRAGVPVIYVVVTAAQEERARRVAARDHQPLAEALARIRRREASERERYERFYGVDLEREPADLTIDATDRSPRDVAETILAFVRAQEASPAL
jgi:CMP/dCMP kinase